MSSELRDRIRQYVLLWTERKGWSGLGREPDRAELQGLISCPVGEVHERAIAGARRLAPGLADPPRTAAAVRRRFPHATDTLLRRAARIADGQVQLLGYSELDFGRPIDWRFDPVSGIRSDLIHWSRLRYLDYGAVGDHKVVWELNRHANFVTLAQASLLDGDDRWSAVLGESLALWMDENPPAHGINWASSLEVAFRGIAWLHVLALAGDHLDHALVQRMIGMLHRHAWHIQRHLSTWFSPNTHLTGEALGLSLLGRGLAFFRDASLWSSRGDVLLQVEAQRQLHSDGVYFEQTTYYHRYTTDFYLHLLLTFQASGEPPPVWLLRTVDTLADVLTALRRPDATWPLIGDEDGGQLLSYNRREPNDFRDTMSLAGSLRSRPDYCRAAGGSTPEQLWLLGCDSECVALDTENRTIGGILPDGGFIAAGSELMGDWFLLDAGPHGALSGGHAHVDALAVEIMAGGRMVVEDSGTGTYVGDAALRDELRSAPAHGTVSVNGAGAALPGGPFSWASRSEARITGYRRTGDLVFARGEQDGFIRRGLAGVHQRELIWIGESRLWVIRDTISTGSGATITQHFPLAAGLEASVEGSRATVLEGKRPTLGIWVVQPATPALRTRESRRSPAYGRVQSAAAVDVSASSSPVVTVLAAAPDEITEFSLSLGHDPSQFALTIGRAGRRVQVSAHGRAWSVDGLSVSSDTIEVG